MAICKNVENNNICLTNKNGTILCRYHRRNRIWPVRHLKPQGLCPEAYHQLYPILFSAVYAPHAELLDGSIVARCPAVNDNAVEFEVFRTPAKLSRRTINIVKKMISRFRSTEVLAHRVFIRVKSSSDTCPYRYGKGETFELNLGGGKEICPAAFYNIFPPLMPNIYGFSKDENGWFGCPDHKTNIMFAVHNPSEKQAQLSLPACCESRDKLSLSVRDVKGSCRLNLKTGQLFRVGEILDKLGFPCVSAFHSLYPYIYTLLNEGKLGFQSGSYSAAMVQCPSSSSKVEMFLEGLENRDLKVTIKKTKADCPMGIKAGKAYIISHQVFNEFCYLAFASLTPYVIHPHLLKETLFCCPGHDGIVNFEISGVCNR